MSIEIKAEESSNEPGVPSMRRLRAYENSRIRMIDLKAVDFDAKAIRTISIKGEEQIEDVTSTGK